MSLTGIEVENVRRLDEGLKKIVVGFIKDCRPHPDSDHLSICQVDVGEAEPSQIICGAPNVQADKKVIVALPGARIAGNIKIKKGKMRGEVSNGMICSLQELGIADNVVPKAYSEGIFFLPDDSKVGMSVFPILGMDDSMIELSITPNRADALSMRGTAFEVGAVYRQKPVFTDKKVIEDDSAAADQLIQVMVEDEADAPTYKIRMIKDVKIKESPLWLQNRLIHAGIRPINNIVDVTNYCLLEFGQPMHAFDYDKIQTVKIVVRRANAGEKLVTLDGEQRTLTADNILITNGETPLALAGVMGGLDSEITEKTTTVALESAVFDPISIRKTAKMFNLRSESSSRFEKGINVATVQEACDFAGAMMAELSGGTVVSKTVTATSMKLKPVLVKITLAKINRSLGTTLTIEQVNEIFAALGFKYDLNHDQYEVTIPPRRWDIAIEADILEEVARIYGYDRLPSTLPGGQVQPGSLTKSQQLMRATKTLLEGSGLTEAISYALTTEEKAAHFLQKESFPTVLQFPMSEERTTMRMNLISGLLDDLAYNVSRKNENIAYYEVGRVFYQNKSADSLPIEENHLAIAVTGNWQEKDWQTIKQPVDFFVIKGIIENLFSMYGLTNQITYQNSQDYPEMHPGRTARILLDGENIGFIGQVHPITAKKYGLESAFVGELNIQQIFAADRKGIIYKEVSKYPAVKRDIALLVDENITNQSLRSGIHAAGGRLLHRVELFDLYQGKNIEKGKKSLAYTLTFMDPETTLTEEEINQALNKIQKRLRSDFSAEIR